MGSNVTVDGDCSHEIKRRFLLGRKAMTKLHSILKNRDITLPTNVHRVKALVFSAVMYGYESWTIKKRLSIKEFVFELWCWRRPSRGVPWIARRSNQSVLRKSILNIHRKDCCWNSILWSPDRKHWLIGKDPDADKD